MQFIQKPSIQHVPVGAQLATFRDDEITVNVPIEYTQSCHLPFRVITG